MTRPQDKDPAAAKDLLDWLGLTDTPDWTRARALGAAVSVALCVLFVLALAAAFATLSRALMPAPEAAGGSLGAGALITAILGAPFLIWATVIKHRALGFQKEGHLTDRISKAVEQLGAEKSIKEHLVDTAGSKVYRKDEEGRLDVSQPVTIERTVPNIEVRIGGILSLERIAQDSCNYDKGRDHVRVMEILCAYVRENAPASGAKDSIRWKYERETEDSSDGPGLTDEHFCTGHGIYPTDLKEALGIDALKRWSKALPKPRADIALALRVIGRRNSGQRRVEARWGKDASSDALWVFDQEIQSFPDTVHAGKEPMESVSAARAAFRTWQNSLENYDGYRLDLRTSNLQGADLSGLSFSGARMEKTRLEGADLQSARLDGAWLTEAKLDGATFWGARMAAANLHNAWLEGTELFGVRMEGANCDYVRMEGSSFWQARMSWAFLFRARLEGTKFRETEVTGASFMESRMTGAELHLVDFSKAKINFEQLAEGFGSGSVILPDGKGPESAEWPPHWPKGALKLIPFRRELEKWRDAPRTYVPQAP